LRLRQAHARRQRHARHHVDRCRGSAVAIWASKRSAIALGQLRQAREAGIPVGTVLGDAGYGDECDFRVGVAALDLRYVLGIRSATTVWPPGQAPLPPAPWSGRGRPPTRLRRSTEHQPVSVKDLAMGSVLLSRRIHARPH
jgi:SRSO17 transposase